MATIEQVINTYISEERSKLPSFRKPGIHPSEIGETPFCVRKQIFKNLDKEHSLHANTFSTRTYKIFDIGHALHDQWRQQYLGPSGKLFGLWKCSRCHKVKEGYQPKKACECCMTFPKTGSDLGRLPKRGKVGSCKTICGASGPTSPRRGLLSLQKMEERGGCIHCGKWGSWDYQEYSIKIKDIAGIKGLDAVGHVDGVLVDADGNKKIVDIKTINQTGFDWLKSPKDSYVYQLHLYMEGLDIKDSCILYVNKTDGSMKLFDVPYDKEKINDLYGRIKVQHAASKNEELPSMHPKCTPKSTMRKYCPFGSDFSECACPHVTTKGEFVSFYKGDKDVYVSKTTPPRESTPRKKKERAFDSGFNNFGRNT